LDLAFTPVTSADIEFLLAYVEDLYEFLGIRFDEHRARAAIQGLIDAPALGGIWLIYEASDPVGYLALTSGYSLEFGGRTAFIDELYVRPESRRRGIGAQALAFAEQACRNLGLHAVHLEVARNNTEARRLYQASGFAAHDSYLMTKRLRP
jgi:GNAT superfamily N-acetyltransferase